MHGLYSSLIAVAGGSGVHCNPDLRIGRYSYGGLFRRDRHLFFLQEFSEVAHGVLVPASVHAEKRNTDDQGKCECHNYES